MKLLAQGVVIKTKTLTFTVHGAVVGVVADTLAAHAWWEGVEFAFRKCRRCLASSDDFDK